MFDALDTAPPDAILGLTEAFNKETNPKKINLAVGVYKDGSGRTPVLAAVKKAEERLVSEETTKGYLPIEGAETYGEVVRGLLFGPDHEIVSARRAVTAHTPGGTGALRVAADFLAQVFTDVTIWLSDPTWPNHPGVFESAGLKIAQYPYYDKASKTLDFEAMTAALEKAAAGDVVVLHACCHNPSGMDPTFEQWTALSELIRSKKLLPLFDFAYQGLGHGLEEDARGLRQFCGQGVELLIASSFSKNFGLYRERTGALTLVAASEDQALAALSHLKRVIRVNYSNPPSHGGAIVSTVLNDAALKAEWLEELKSMCARISTMRRLFADTLKVKGVRDDFSFITRQNGMFSFSGLSKEQVAGLREEWGVYIVGSGRINVAGMTESNMDYLCEAIAAVMK